MPRGGSKPGERRGGRQKGTPNKMSVLVRQGIQQAFEDLGGVPALVRWARRNKTLFYTRVMTRIVPVPIVGPNDEPLPLRIELTDGTATASRTE